MEFDKKKLPTYIMAATIAGVVVWFNISYLHGHISSNNEKISNYSLTDEDINPTRKTAVAGLFYPADTYQLDKNLDGYLEHFSSDNGTQPQIIIVPHAGYQFSAGVAAVAYKRLQPYASKIKNVFILGPSHYVYTKGVALSSANSFKTPLGNITVNTALVEELSQNKLFSFNDEAHRKEHSIEVQLPFLQKVLENFNIIPMAYGDIKPEYIAEILEPYLAKNDSLLVVSADLSHYLSYEEAKKEDEKTAEKIQNAIPLDDHNSCGASGINTAMLIAKKHGLIPNMLDLINSGDTGSDKFRVVGYGAWSFEKHEENLKGIDLEQRNLENFARHNKNQLFDIVNKSLNEAVVNNAHFEPSRDDFDNVLFNKGASFVTLKLDGKLRGCIGSLIANRAIAIDLAQNAYNAAMHDNRFSPLTKEELKKITFSISLLTDFEKIDYTSYDDLITKIKPFEDGILINDGERKGVFLPSVWEMIPNKNDFMSELKIKAGLSPSYWSDEIKVFKFKTVEIKNDNN